MCTGLELLSLAGTGIGTLGQISQARRQERDEERRAAFARQQAEQMRIEEDRLRREASRRIEEDVETIDPTDRLADIDERTQALEQTFSEGTPLLQGDHNLDAVIPMNAINRGGEVVTSDLARRLAGAAEDAQRRVAGIAGLSAFGGDALQRRNELTALGQDLDLFNTLRGDVRGTTRTNLSIMNNQPPPQGSELAAIFGAGLANAPRFADMLPSTTPTTTPTTVSPFGSGVAFGP